jgi:serine-type D-Ala-D-Ala carboxypeptidase/endopeptidase
MKPLGLSFLILTTLVVSAADRKAAVDQLVQPAIDSRTAAGIVVAVIEGGKTQVFGYGKGAGGRVPDAMSVFEIGSVTKTFTTTALAEMVQRKMVALEDPVRKYLPPDAVPPTVAQPGKEGDKEIRLVDLATQHSGLPRLPGNMNPKDPTNPYADYTPQLLYEFLAKQTLHLNSNTTFLYSNLGMGLLGHALSLRYGKPYEQMISELVATPLDMPDTRVTLTADEKNRLAPGHDADGKVVPNWDLPTLAGAGALRSTANDLLRYVQAHMDPPQKLKPAIELAHVERHKIAGAGAIALAWIIKPDGKTYWHNGGTGGYTTYISFHTERKTGVVVLINSAGNLMDQIGDRLEHMLANEAVQPLPIRRSVTLDSKTLDEYVGAYELVPNVRITVTRQGDQMFAQLTGQSPLGIHAEAKDKFFLRAVEASVTFERDAQGKISACVLHQNGRDQKAKRVQ